MTSKGQKVITVMIEEIDLEFTCIADFIYRKPALFLVGTE